MKAIFDNPIAGTIAIVATALGFTSCGTPIPMQEMVPAKITVPRNARVCVVASGPGASQMQQAAQQVVGGDDFFTLVYSGADLAIDIDTDRTVENRSYTDKKGRTHYYTIEKSYANLSLLNCHDRSILTTTGTQYIGSDFSGWNCRDAVKDFYDDIHPHVKDYTVRVSIDKDKNPNLFVAAQLCQAGKWDEAYAQVQQSITAVPNDPEAYFLKAMIERENFKYDESDASLQQAIQIEPKSKYTSAIQKNASLRVTQAQAVAQMENAL